MEIFDEEIYQKLSEEYQKAIMNAPLGGMMRAVRGEMPFRIEKKAESVDLKRASMLNARLITMTEPMKGYRVQTFRKLLEMNKRELPEQNSVGEIVSVGRYENPIVKVCCELVCELEGKRGAERLLARSYCLLSAAFCL